MAEFEFSGKKFAYHKKVTNRMVIELTNLTDSENGNVWHLDEEKIPKVMATILEGPHTEIDWLDQDQAETLRTYNGFFRYCVERAKLSENS